ncbi:hypothetical protein RIF29_30702 [Crotalaria pallida]|uniref:Protein FAR1-RELATED SEQUENCE n=1 Tax=Crotalaria pallida TaxID=3830 RepID=A0AAN9ELM5_CROPI
MDKFVEDPVVNLDDDNSASDESGDEEHDELGDKNGPASGDQYKRITDLTADDIWGLEFGSEEAAYQFYSRYARCIGFYVRKEAIIGRNSAGNRNKRLYGLSPFLPYVGYPFFNQNLHRHPVYQQFPQGIATSASDISSGWIWCNWKCSNLFATFIGLDLVLVPENALKVLLIFIMLDLVQLKIL